METWIQDLRYGARTLIRRPGFTLIAVAALALGIGANTAIFSVVNGVLLRPLPYREANRLVTVFGSGEWFKKFRQIAVSPADFVQWKERQTVFEDMAVYTGGPFNMAGADRPARVDGIAVSANFFAVLGVGPVLGRAFADEENQPGRNHIAIISHAVWKRAFNSDPEILNRSLKLDGEIYQVVGVMPEDFRFVERADLITPAQIDPNYSANSFLRVIGRLKPGATIEQAQAETASIAPGLKKDGSRPGIFNLEEASIVPLHELIAEKSRTMLVVLFGAVGFVLLIACANIANLLLARATARRKEMAIRAAVGAGRLRLIRQMLTESLLLALAGGAGGTFLAAWGLDLLLDLAPPTLSRANPIEIDGKVLAFTLLVSVATGVLFGLAPALQSSRLDLTTALKEGGGANQKGIARLSLRGLLVVGQIALALVLLVGAGLLVKSFARLMNVDKGFETDNLLTLNVALPDTYKTPEQMKRFYAEALGRIRNLPGVSTAGTVSQLPLGDMKLSGDFQIEGQPPLPDGTLAGKVIVSPDYFRAMRIPLVAGRQFSDADTSVSKNVVIINESFARTFFDNDNPIGRRISMDNDPDGKPVWTEVVGMARNTRQERLNSEFEPAIFAPYSQTSRPFFLNFVTFVIRTDREPSQLAATIEREIQAVDAELPAFRVRTMRQVVSESASDPRFNALLLALFAGLALTLAVVGIYGVISYSVTERTREIGIRIALGANRGDVLRLVVKEGMRLAIAGVVVGLAASLALTRLVGSLLYEVSATDPATFVIIPLILTGVALGACAVPARRATRVDPIVALRYE